MRIARDGLLEPRQHLPHLPLVERREHRLGAQIGVIGAEIARRAVGRPRGLGGPQRRLDDAGNADGDLFLQFEHVFKRAVEAVGP